MDVNLLSQFLFSSGILKTIGRRDPASAAGLARLDYHGETAFS
jgi:hypothetical protein